MAKELTRHQKAYGMDAAHLKEGGIPGSNEYLAKGSLGDDGHLYYCITSKKSRLSVIRRLTKHDGPLIAQNGGCGSGWCSLTLPNGETFYSLWIRGDVAGLKKDIKLSAIEHGDSILAEIHNDVLCIEDGRKFPLSELDVTWAGQW